MYEKKTKKKAKQLIAFGSALQCSSFCKKFLSRHTRTIALLEQSLKKINTRNTIISEHKNWKTRV